MMCSFKTKFNYSLVFLVVLIYNIQLSSNKDFKDIDPKYHLAAESYNLATDLFRQGRDSYTHVKTKSLQTIDTFLDLVSIMNEEMAKELRSSILKFYKIKYFHDFTQYAISMEEMIDIVEHCLTDPVEKLAETRIQFHNVIKNFEDIRNFDTVQKCANELPDEVAVAHCTLHQAVLFNETMHESLLTIVELKTRQYAQDMNSSIYGVEQCLDDFVPKFFDQLLVDAYTTNCGYLRVVNASIGDLMRDRWRNKESFFPSKWSPLVSVLKERAKEHVNEPLFLTLFAANLTSMDVVSTLYR